MSKAFVLDTSVLIEDPTAIGAFGDNTVVIPLVVLRELDKLKSRQDIVGSQARRAIRTLDDLRSAGEWLSEGVVCNEEGGKVVVSTVCKSADSNDEAIIQTAAKYNGGCTLITNDINMRVQADAIKIASEPYEWEGKSTQSQDIYNGAARLDLTAEEIDDLYERGAIDLTAETAADLYPHQFLIGKHGTKSCIARYYNGQAHRLLVTEHHKVGGLTPKNKEQQFALDMLMDAKLPLVTLVGKAGCGKTLLAIAAGLEQVLENGSKYDKIIVSRPVQPLGKDIGYLPGSMEEKMAPWIQPIKDNLMFCLGKDKRTIELKFSDGTIEIEALSYIRGRSIPNAYIIIDEAQNLSVMEMKAIVTRVGVGSKLVITGDIEQIDNHRFDAHTNGLAYLIEKMKDEEIAGHITLLKGERSPLATLAATKL